MTTFSGQPVNCGTYKNIAATTTGTIINTGEGVLYSITFNTPTATSVITIYDGISTSGTKIGTITVPTSPMATTLFYNVQYLVGLYIVMATANSDITLNFK